MKGIGARIVKTLTTSTRLACSDNSGAKELMIIGVIGGKGVRGRYPKAGIGDVVIASVKKGRPDMVKKKVRALIIRQKKGFKRPNGWTILFEDNAAVVVNDDNLPVGTEIKGVVAREVSERYPKVAAIAQGII
ncbi:uL14 family ribosomal protein [Candidatus Micrarchaeota archaeon]|nr:uL14 family ribosomal protein [Candidatus Micrarchaeota archaeon]